MPRPLTRIEFDYEVNQRLDGESPWWFLVSGVLSGAAPWLLRSVQRGDVGMPELTDVIIGVSVGAALEMWRRISGRRRASYDVYKEFADHADEVERDLSEELKSARDSAPSRPRNQAISDSLHVFHARGEQLLHTRIKNQDEREAWKQQWQHFRTDLYAAMEQMGCSLSEIHKVKHLGAVPQLQSFKNTISGALNLKSELIALMDRIGEVAKSHDTTTPH